MVSPFGPNGRFGAQILIKSRHGVFKFSRKGEKEEKKKMKLKILIYLFIYLAASE